MDAARLIAMANQIGRFFHAQGEAAVVAGVEDHLRRFWDPRMRREIVAVAQTKQARIRWSCWKRGVC